MKKETVNIYGAGMSGLIAAINLAREDHEVVVHDREKGYGGDPRYNPSTHTTPIDLEAVSGYIGIDISPAFHQVTYCPQYLHDTKLYIPPDVLKGTFTVERGNRETSLDTLLYREALELGVQFSWEDPLKREMLSKLPVNTIIAGGLTPSVYEMLDIPFLRWYGWISRGEIGFSGISWAWLDEGITEYGYLSSANNYYFNLLFSIRHVSRETLEKYQDFMRRNEGVEHLDWEYSGGAVPIASPDNPRLFWNDCILCGTLSGLMDPMMWFGILGATIGGKVAALAVTDRDRAVSDFRRFSRNFRKAFYLKNQAFYRMRPHVAALEKLANLVGPDRAGGAMGKLINSKSAPSAIPGLNDLRS